VLGDRAARQVALGACFFMLSDSLLATNRFVQPLPLAQVGVLATYYAAQAFIVHGMVWAYASADHSASGWRAGCAAWKGARPSQCSAMRRTVGYGAGQRAR
jgi:hypothetical protein